METLAYRTRGATVAEIAEGVSRRIGPTPPSSVRSYLRLNTPRLFTKIDRGHYVAREEAQATLAFPNGAQADSVRRSQTPKEFASSAAAAAVEREAFRFGNVTLIHGDCFDWLAKAPTNSVEAVVTDPPYGLVEYSEHLILESLAETRASRIIVRDRIKELALSLLNEADCHGANRRSASRMTSE